MNQPAANSRPVGHATGQRRLSWRLFRHVWGQYLTILGCCLLGFEVLFLIADLFDDLQDFLRQGVPAGDVLWYFTLLQPDHLVQILPMSLLLAAVYCVAMMGRNFELNALRASGISVRQATLPILVTAVLAMLLLVILNETVIYQARPRAQALKRALTESPDQASTARRYILAFHQASDQRDWYFRVFRAQGLCEEVRVVQFRPDRTIDWELSAATAQWTPAGWVFYQAVRLEFDPALGRFTGADQRYETLNLDLPERPGHMQFFFRVKPSSELNTLDLWRLIHASDGELAASTLAVLRTQLAWQICVPFACLLAVLLGIPLAIGEQRSSVMRGAVLAIGLLALYYVGANVFMVLGRSQTLSPWLAGALPTAAFLCWSTWLYARRQ